jgi:tetratricopeptide (TPR) repeat protein
MRKPPDSNLDLGLAREVCLRDGGIRALVTGRTEKYGDAYVFSVQLMDPVRNVPVALHSEAAAGPDQMWPAVRRLSNWVRESLGEAMDRIERSNKELEKVTTPSLHAFQLFTEANRANKRSQWQVSAELLRQAVSEDPNFASAHAWLAWDLKNLKDTGWVQEIKRATDLSGTVTGREAYFIRASYYLLHDQTQSAIPVLEALVRLYPDHYFGNTNLVMAYTAVGRVEDARRARAHYADLRPNDYTTNARATMDLIQVDVDGASKYAQRARVLAETGLPDPPAPLDTAVMLSRFDELWAHEDVPGAYAELKQQLQRPQTGDWPAAIAIRYFRLGRNADAMAMIQKDAGYVREPLSRFTIAFRLDFYSGKDEEAREILKAQLRSNPSRILTEAFAASQLGVPGWEQCLSGGPPRIPESTNLAKGALALQEGRNNDAIALLQTAWNQHNKEMVFGSWIADALSLAFERSGNLPQAAEALERASTERLANPPEWLRNESRLSGLYRKLHRDSEARKIETRVRKLLAFADADHPVLRELNTR